MKVLLFGGTSEGRELAEWLAGQDACRTTVCTATEYGGELVSGLPGVEVVRGRLDARGMRRLMEGFAAGGECKPVVVDATHPYAVEATANIREASAAAGLELLRLVRDGAEADGEWMQVASAEAAVELLNGISGNVLLTTGSKDLAAFCNGVEGAAERLYVRILPAAESLLIAHETGVPMDHIIAMQGPFSEELNCALIREFDIATVVTKASGTRGGFWEKVASARTCGARLVVIARPQLEEGLSVDQVKDKLLQKFGHGIGPLVPDGMQRGA